MFYKRDSYVGGRSYLEMMNFRYTILILINKLYTNDLFIGFQKDAAKRLILMFCWLRKIDG